jgi:hypothetical protein
VDLQSYGSFDAIFRKTITLAFMTYITNLNAYEAHPGDEKFSNNFNNE